MELSRFHDLSYRFGELTKLTQVFFFFFKLNFFQIYPSTVD